MGNNQTKFLNNPNIKLLRNHFSDEELYMLYLIFQDLSSRHHGVVDKETFLQFFPLTGLWGERLFDKFDLKHTGNIDFFAFIKGIANCCHSTEEEKIHFLFNMYDMDQDGFIKKKEMITMLYNYPKNHIKFITDEMAPDGGEKLTRVTEQKRQSLNNLDDYHPPAGSQNFLDSPFKPPAGTMQSVHSDNLDGILNDELEVANEDKLHPNFLHVERDINQSYGFHQQKEHDLKKTIVEKVKEEKERQRPRKITSMERQSIVSKGADGLDALEKKSSIDPAARSKSRDLGDLDSSIQRRSKKNSTVICDQSVVLSTTVNTRVKEYASFMFKTFEGANNRGRISFDEFKQWLQMHPVILKVFDETFHQDIWATADSEQKINSPSSFTEPERQQKETLKHSKSEGFKNENVTLRFKQKACDVEGHLYKKGKRSGGWTKRYFELKDHFLLYFEKKGDNKPKGIFFLDGCEIEELKDQNQGGKYGFIISHKSESYPSKTLYAASKKEFDDWMAQLKCFKSSTIMDLYTFHEKIGTGKFSIVYRATSKADKNLEYAVKLIEKKLLKPQEKDFLLSETSIIKLLDHPNMIKLIDTIETKSNIYIITEIVKDGDLFDYIVTKEFVEEHDASFIIKQLLRSVDYMHSIGIIHRDIKPENILITLGNDDAVKEIKIIDFGFAKLVNEGGKILDTCGTPNYVAPEVLRGSGYDKKADVFSVGCIMFLMLRGLLPFDANDVNLILTNTLKAEICMEDSHWEKISPEAKDLLNKFLTKDPSKRIEIAEALQHPWIKNREELKKYIGVNRNAQGSKELDDE